MHEALFFEPLFRQYLWGGRRLKSVLNKAIGPQPCYAESWELVDHGPDQSVVVRGPLAGKTLAELIDQYPQELLGAAGADKGKQFPLLFKYLDCNRVLSVQVHPDDAYARTMDPPDRGKTEAWYIVDAEPESVIYAGLKSGVQAEDLRQACAQGRTDEVLHTIKASIGDCIFIPAGTVHALGSGLLVAEIQQSSDTTFRLFDWNRVDQDGKPRPLHIEQAIAVTDFERGPVMPQSPQALPGGWGDSLVRCDKFALDRYRGPCRCSLPNIDGFQILTVAAGQAQFSCGGRPLETLAMGQTTLIPAATQSLEIQLANDHDTLLVASPGGLG